MAEDKAIRFLNTLIETNADAHHGYQVAAHSIRDMKLKRQLGKFALERKRFEDHLRDEVKRLGGAPHTHGTVTGALHRGWMQLREELGHPSAHEVLTECRRGEDVSRKHYRAALGSEIPIAVRRILARQLARIEEVYEELDALDL